MSEEQDLAVLARKLANTSRHISWMRHHYECSSDPWTCRLRDFKSIHEGHVDDRGQLLDYEITDGHW